MSKHTPGDWEIKFGTNIVARNGRRLIANCGGHQNSEVDQTAENEANAHRIVRMNSSYDDLLAACEAAHDAIDILFAMLVMKDRSFMPSRSGAPWDALLKINSAVEKAKGTI